MIESPPKPRRHRGSIEARASATQLAFAPLVFQTARVMRDTGLLQTLQDHGPLSLTDLVERLHLPAYGVTVLLESGLGTGLVEEDANQLWSLGDVGWWLLNDTMTKVNMDFVNDVCWHGAPALEEAIRTGSPAGLKTLGPWSTVYEGLSQFPEPAKTSWFAFDHFYSDGAFASILKTIFSSPCSRLLDVGGNTGRFALQCFEYDDQVEVTILDLPGQLAKAEASIREAGHERRFHGHAMDLLDHRQNFPTGYSAVLMSQFLDCFGEDDIRELLRRGRAALAPGGHLHILETCWDRQAFPAASHALRQISLYFTIIANGTSRMYRAETLRRLAGEAGLEVIQEEDHIGYGHTLFTCQAADT